jgi:hypothetical protein
MHFGYFSEERPLAAYVVQRHDALLRLARLWIRGIDRFTRPRDTGCKAQLQQSSSGRRFVA